MPNHSAYTYIYKITLIGSFSFCNLHPQDLQVFIALISQTRLLTRGRINDRVGNSLYCTGAKLALCCTTALTHRKKVQESSSKFLVGKLE